MAEISSVVYLNDVFLSHKFTAKIKFGQKIIYFEILGQKPIFGPKNSKFLPKIMFNSNLYQIYLLTSQDAKTCKVRKMGPK